MEHKDVQTQINEIKNDSERKIAKLLYDIGFNFVSANSIITNNKNIEIGEIDLLFTHDDYLLIVEVSTATHKKKDKISSFFNKWSDRNNIHLMLNKHELSSRKTIKIYFDLNATEPTSSHAINILLENDSLNKLANYTDYMYFKEQCELIGHWSKNDFLNWLDLENMYENKPIDAIQFYVGDTVVFCFVARVSVLLKSCYVSRRRNKSEGYQRILNKTRIKKMLTNINRPDSLTFPNSILISTPRLTEQIIPKENCPKITKINFPTSYTSCKIIDGQHRLLGFSKISPELQQDHSLPVIAIPDLGKNMEIKTFIAINTNQKRIDANLLLLLKSDQNWGIGTKEYYEKIAVLSSLRLNKTFLKNRVYSGSEKKPKDSITLNTLVTSMTRSKQILDTFEKTNNKIQKLFESVISNISDQAFDKDNFFGKNFGLRVLFRLSKLYEINTQKGNMGVSLDCFFHDLNIIMSNDDILDSLNKFSGNVGVHDAAKYLIEMLEKYHGEKYLHMTYDLT